jgi:hypothetical protein
MSETSQKTVRIYIHKKYQGICREYSGYHVAGASGKISVTSLIQLEYNTIFV